MIDTRKVADRSVLCHYRDISETVICGVKHHTDCCNRCLGNIAVVLVVDTPAASSSTAVHLGVAEVQSGEAPWSGGTYPSTRKAYHV